MFCLKQTKLTIHYAWQEKEDKQGVKSRPSKRLNVIGLLNKNNELDSYVFECKIRARYCDKIY